MQKDTQYKNQNFPLQLSLMLNGTICKKVNKDINCMLSKVDVVNFKSNL